MKTQRPLAFLLLLSFLLALGLAPDADARKKKGKRKNKRKKAAVAKEIELPVGQGNCKEAEPFDPRLVQGLSLYQDAQFKEAGQALLPWAESATAAEDPAAGKGFYSLGYVFSVQRRAAMSRRWFKRALPVLAAQAEENPTLEGYYYMASLHRNEGATSQLLTVAARALEDLESGKICPRPDGDDYFRKARLLKFVGKEGLRMEALQSAAAAYDKAGSGVSSYVALTNKELGDHYRVLGDWDACERYYRAAAFADPTTPGVHRELGLALMQQGDLAGASDYWRKHWRDERDNGNGLIYYRFVLGGLLRHQKNFGGDELMDGLASYSTVALKENAIYEAKRYTEAFQKIAAAQLAATTATQPSSSEAPAVDIVTLEKLKKVSSYRMHQYLGEFIMRGNDLQEFALQNGLLPVLRAK